MSFVRLVLPNEQNDLFAVLSLCELVLLQEIRLPQKN